MTEFDYLRFVLALVFVLGLIGAFGLLVRRYGPGAGLAVRPRGQDRRLAVTEVLTLDARRRLVLVRRDDVEHLLLLGQEGDRVVESGIRVASPSPAAGFRQALADTVTDPARHPAPRNQAP